MTKRRRGWKLAKVRSLVPVNVEKRKSAPDVQRRRLRSRTLCDAQQRPIMFHLPARLCPKRLKSLLTGNDKNLGITAADVLEHPQVVFLLILIWRLIGTNSFNHCCREPFSSFSSLKFLNFLLPKTLKPGHVSQQIVPKTSSGSISLQSAVTFDLPVCLICLFQAFGEESVLLDDLQEEDEEEEEPELILDGGLPRYASSLTSDLLPFEEGREMAVDEEVEVEKREEEVMERVKQSTGSLLRKPPPSWEEWEVTSSRTTREAAEVKENFSVSTQSLKLEAKTSRSM